MNQAVEMQQLMFSTDKDTNCLLDQVNENNHLKRKTNEKENESEQEDEEDDEEIYSDTDEEFQANQKKKLKKNEASPELTFKHLKPDLVEGYLDRINKKFHK